MNIQHRGIFWRGEARQEIVTLTEWLQLKIEKNAKSKNLLSFLLEHGKKFQKGFTLVELLVVMVITAFVIAMVAMFISMGSRSYNHASNDIKLQMMSQTVTNQLDDIIIEANWVENKTLSPEVSAFVIYASSNISVIFFDSKTEEIYMKDGFIQSDILTRPMSVSTIVLELTH